MELWGRAGGGMRDRAVSNVSGGKLCKDIQMAGVISVLPSWTINLSVITRIPVKIRVSAALNVSISIDGWGPTYEPPWNSLRLPKVKMTRVTTHTHTHAGGEDKPWGWTQELWFLAVVLVTLDPLQGPGWYIWPFYFQCKIRSYYIAEEMQKPATPGPLSVLHFLIAFHFSVNGFVPWMTAVWRFPRPVNKILPEGIQTCGGSDYWC